MIPVGAYVSTHLAARRIRKQNSSSNNTHVDLDNLPLSTIEYEPIFISRSDKIVKYKPHKIHTKHFGNLTIEHGYKNENLNLRFKEIRKGLIKDFIDYLIWNYIGTFIVVIFFGIAFYLSFVL